MLRYNIFKRVAPLSISNRYTIKITKPVLFNHMDDIDSSVFSK